MQRPRITEINVRMDCNGCVQKIKKALNGINGIYDLYIDFPQQKLTVIGWADPERIIKAIKKVRKIATICSHTEAPDPNSQPTEASPPDGAAPSSDHSDGGAPPPEGGAPPQDAGNTQPAEPPQPEEAPPPPQEPPRDQPPPPLPHQNSQTQNPQLESNHPAEPQHGQPINNYRSKDVEEVQVVYHNPPDYGHRYGYRDGYGPGYSHGPHGFGGQWSNHPGTTYRNQQPPQPVYREPPPQSNYHEPLPQPVYRERPRPTYHEPPTHHVYHEPPPRPFYHEPTSRPIYHEPQSQPIYHEPPSQPIYHEQPPRTVYHEPRPQPIRATHSYNMYRPSTSITEYQYVRSPPQHTSYGMMDHYNMDPYRNGGPSNGNVTSIFSDENPNACTIV